MNGFQHINMTNFINIFFSIFWYLLSLLKFSSPRGQKIFSRVWKKNQWNFSIGHGKFSILISQTLPIFQEKLHFFFKFFDIFVVFLDCFFSRTKKPPRGYFVNWMHSFQKCCNVSQHLNFTNFSIFLTILEIFLIFWRLLLLFRFFRIQGPKNLL